MRKPRIGFILLKDLPGFGGTDLTLIAKNFPTRVWQVRYRPRYLLDAIGIFFLTLRSDITVTRWAHTQAYWQVRWGKLLGKKTVVLIGGGADTVDEAWLGRRFSEKHIEMLRYTLNNATLVVANSNYVLKTTRAYTTRDDIPVVYDGFDPDVYSHDGRKKEDMVLTISSITKEYVKRKGIVTFIQAAKRLPNVRFVIIGALIDISLHHRLKEMAPPNVEFTGEIPEDKIKIDYMRRAKVYAQLSLTEGCPWAISEAMLCECVPVATRGGGTPEIVGDTEYYVPYSDAEATAEAIKGAIKNEEKGKLARDRVKTSISLDLRERGLVEGIKQVQRN